ncbi:hypothetical protein QBZ16_002176 [Prototheca wickerhamii]|uniref:Uncharacterized protein n=1 Tax=Prototheca wickerhamii TaxID=3111 RepID=A0AAD9ILB4_PROWI|nr:hypothetical protein QBZ16_002176 [Prototheca wickerhamii]
MISVKEDLHDKPWALESDLRTGTALRTDKTGRAIITVLRHLGRITEARVNVGGSMLSAFLLNV